MSLNSKIFDNTSFSDIMKDIYTNQKKKQKQIMSMIGELKPLVENIGDATLLVPLIANYLDISVKNDDQLVKLASIIQKTLQKSNEEDNTNPHNLTESEKEQIMMEVEKIHKNSK